METDPEGRPGEGTQGEDGHLPEGGREAPSASFPAALRRGQTRQHRHVGLDAPVCGTLLQHLKLIHGPRGGKSIDCKLLHLFPPTFKLFI